MRTAEPSKNESTRVLLFGGGYVGLRAAQRWIDSGSSVTIVTRSASKAQKLQTQGFQTSVADITRPDTLDKLPMAETIFFSVGFDGSPQNTIHQVYADGMRHLLSMLSGRLATSSNCPVRRIIYLSTTGVYATSPGHAPQAEGSTDAADPNWPVGAEQPNWPVGAEQPNWIDEQGATLPQRAGARASLAAEQLLANSLLGKRAVILRAAGIYGPGRVPHQQKLIAGEPLAVPQSTWLNLIHVDDCVSAVLVADRWSRPQSQGPEYVNVSDGHPVLRADFYHQVSKIIGCPPPNFSEPDQNLPATRRATGNKRICNKKLLKTLNMKLAYPSYREGLSAILD